MAVTICQGILLNNCILTMLIGLCIVHECKQ